MEEESKPEWKTKFAEATGQYAFVLTLSKRQVRLLEVLRLATGGHWGERPAWDQLVARAIGFGGYVSTMRALESRGLVDMRKGLTPAGVSVCEMLTHAGLIEPIKVEAAASAA